MTRRTIGFLVILALSLLWPLLAAEAQRRGKIPLVSWLDPGYPPTASAPHPLLDAFRQGLRQLGYAEGQTSRLAYRFAAYQWDQLPALAAELVQLQSDVIVAVLIDPNTAEATLYPSAFEAPARALGMRVQRLDAGTAETISDALATIAHSGAEVIR